MEPKILVTLGPASLSEETVVNCAELDVHLFRLNLSHTPLELIQETIVKVQSWTDVPVCLDSEGAQLRNQNMNGGEVSFEAGDKVELHYQSVLGNKNQISFTPQGMASKFEPGDRLRIDFEGGEFEILEKYSDFCLAVATRSGKVASNKAADINRKLPFDALTPKDKEAIKIGRELGVKNFALSFANRRADVKKMRAACGNGANIISKIESSDGVRNLDEILRETDEIIVDRGDLSRQVDLHKIPIFQRLIITAANEVGKHVFVATNLLETMTDKPSPTRAEVNDVVSTLLMGADGLVLAAETAIGKHPLEAVRMIRLLIDEVKNWNPDATLDDLLDS